METTTITRTPKTQEALVHGLRARLSVGTRVGQTWSDSYRKALTATAKAHYVSEEEVEDAYIADGIEQARLEGEERADA